jgi:hypothetical protein
MTAIPDDYPSMVAYFPMLRQIRALAKQQSPGISVVTLRVIVNEFGQPMPELSMMPTIQKLSPKYTADAALKEVIELLMGDEAT